MRPLRTLFIISPSKYSILNLAHLAILVQNSSSSSDANREKSSYHDCFEYFIRIKLNVIIDIKLEYYQINCETTLILKHRRAHEIFLARALARANTTISITYATRRHSVCGKSDLIDLKFKNSFHTLFWRAFVRACTPIYLMVSKT